MGLRELSLHILDIVSNSIEAGATFVEICVREDIAGNLLSISIADNGTGMPESLVRSVLDPFVTTRTTRKVGLGLPLFREAARRSGGDLVIFSEEGKGTRVEAIFRHDDIDRAPFGDMASTIACIVACNPDLDLRYVHEVNGESFELDTREIRRHIAPVSLGDPRVVVWIKEVVADEGRGEGHSED